VPVQNDDLIAGFFSNDFLVENRRAVKWPSPFRSILFQHLCLSPSQGSAASDNSLRFRTSLQCDFKLVSISSGVDSVRAYKAEERFKALFEALIDVNHRCYILFVHGSRWLGVRLDLLAALCVTVAATCVLVLRNHLAPGIAGVVLVQSLQLTGLFQVSFLERETPTLGVNDKR
jgi:hypothetical protein